MIFAFCAAAPLDHPAPVRIEQEFASFIRASGESGREIRMSGVFPASIQKIQSRGNSDVLHISTHGSEDGLELEDSIGNSRVCPKEAIAKALAHSSPYLLFLSGCHTESTASHIHKTAALRKPWIVSTTAAISDGEINAYVEQFYLEFFRTANPRQSFEKANSGVRNNLWFLHQGSSTLDIKDGSIEVESSLTDVVNWASKISSIVRPRKELSSLHNFLINPRPAMWVTGHPGSGVSTILRLAELRYAGGYKKRCVSVDLEGLDLKQVEDAIYAKLGQRHSTLQTLLQSVPVLICLDNFHKALPRLKQELIAVISGLQPSAQAKILIGTLLENELADLGSKPLKLGLLSFDQAKDYLIKEVGEIRVAQIQYRPSARYPAGWVNFVNDIKNGADDGELLGRETEGDQRVGMGRQIDHVLKDDAISTLFQLFQILGTFTPREIIWEAYKNISSHAEETVASFEMAIAKLRNLQLLFVESVQRSATSIPESFFTFSPEVRRIIQERRTDLAPSDRSEVVNVTLTIALKRAGDKALSRDHDANWLHHVSSTALNLRHFERVVELGKRLFGLEWGRFRFFPNSDVERLALNIREAASLAGDWDEASFYGLVIGENKYRSGQLREAEEIFRSSISQQCPDNRRLQFLRALGQINYRWGKYNEALAYYDDALKYANQALSDHVASVKLYRAKALCRLNQYGPALESLEKCIRLQKRQVNEAQLNAYHEKAKILQRLGRLEEAEALYVDVITSAKPLKLDHFLTGPNYQMALLLLEKAPPDLGRAELYLQECKKHAQSDPFWLSHVHLASAMIAFEKRCLDDVSSQLQSCLDIANEKRFAQIISDAKSWLSRKLASHHANAVTVSHLIEISYPGLTKSKAEKATRYACNPARINFLSLKFRSDSEERQLHWEQKKGWTCSCEHWKNNLICSHIAAFHLISASSLAQLIAPDTESAELPG